MSRLKREKAQRGVRQGNTNLFRAVTDPKYSQYNIGGILCEPKTAMAYGEEEETRRYGPTKQKGSSSKEVQASHLKEYTSGKTVHVPKKTKQSCPLVE